MKIFGIIVASLLGLVVITFIGWGVRALMLAPRTINKSFETVEGVIDKTLTANNAIYNYEWFKQQVEDIKAIEQKIEIAILARESFKVEAGDRKDWTFEDKTESARLGAISQGLQSQYKDMVATYNARSKMANRNIFQSGVIPSTIEVGSSFLR